MTKLIEDRMVQCKRDTHMPVWVLIAPLAYTIALVTTALALRHVTNFSIIGLKVPAFLPWFGMLGGTIASLIGIFYHNAEWNDNYTYWHFFSGLVGATYGIFGYLFVVAGVNAAGGMRTGKVATSSDFYALVAFVVGYGQHHVNAMVEQVFSAIFQKPKQLGKVKSPVDASLTVQVEGELTIMDDSSPK